MRKKWWTACIYNMAPLKFRARIDGARTRNAIVPISMYLAGPNSTIRAGIYAGRKCWYKTALLNTLIALKPKICLEIGTYLGGTAEVFAHYFENYRPDGILVTADIKKYADLSSSKRIKQVLVHSHITDIGVRHDVSEKDMLPSAGAIEGGPATANAKILSAELKAIGEDGFDFAYIDGDHSEISFLGDLEIVKQVCRPPRYILLDDTKEALHESYRVYRDRVCHEYNHYEFEDWPIFVGVSLIWTKKK